MVVVGYDMMGRRVTFSSCGTMWPGEATAVVVAEAKLLKMTV